MTNKHQELQTKLEALCRILCTRKEKETFTDLWNRHCRIALQGGKDLSGYITEADAYRDLTMEELLLVGDHLDWCFQQNLRHYATFMRTSQLSEESEEQHVATTTS